MRIEESAARALTADGFPVTNGLCQKFARLVVQASDAGHAYDAYWRSSAKLTAEAFRAAGLTLLPTVELEPGDLLYKTEGSGGYGHVGVYLGDGKVAENSTFHWNRSGGRDARGIRTLSQFGAFQYVVRLQKAVNPVERPWQVLVGGQVLQGLHEGGTNFVSARLFGEALGKQVAWIPAVKSVAFESQLLRPCEKMVNGLAYYPIRELADAVGLGVTVNYEKRMVRVD